MSNNDDSGSDSEEETKGSIILENELKEIIEQHGYGLTLKEVRKLLIKRLINLRKAILHYEDDPVFDYLNTKAEKQTAQSMNMNEDDYFRVILLKNSTFLDSSIKSILSFDGDSSDSEAAVTTKNEDEDGDEDDTDDEDDKDSDMEAETSAAQTGGMLSSRWASRR